MNICQFESCQEPVYHNILTEKLFKQIYPPLDGEVRGFEIDDIFYCCLNGHANDLVQCNHKKKLKESN